MIVHTDDDDDDNDAYTKKEYTIILMLSTLKSCEILFFFSSFTFHGKIHDASVNRHRIKNLYDAFTSPILNVLAIPEQTSHLTFFFFSSSL